MPPKKTVRKTKKPVRQTGGNKVESKRPWLDDEYVLKGPWPNGVRPVQERDPLSREWKDYYSRGDAYATPPHLVGRPIVDVPRSRPKKWYERGALGFIKENQIASQLVGKFIRPLGNWLEAKCWGKKKKKVGKKKVKK